MLNTAKSVSQNCLKTAGLVSFWFHITGGNLCAGKSDGYDPWLQQSIAESVRERKR